MPQQNTTVGASATVTAPDLTEARVLAEGSFDRFFGEHPYAVTSERADPSVFNSSGLVVLWEVHFTAEAPS